MFLRTKYGKSGRPGYQDLKSVRSFRVVHFKYVMAYMYLATNFLCFHATIQLVVFSTMSEYHDISDYSPGRQYAGNSFVHFSLFIYIVSTYKPHVNLIVLMFDMQSPEDSLFYPDSSLVLIFYNLKINLPVYYFTKGVQVVCIKQLSLKGEGATFGSLR